MKVALIPGAAMVYSWNGVCCAKAPRMSDEANKTERENIVRDCFLSRASRTTRQKMEEDEGVGS